MASRAFMIRGSGTSVTSTESLPIQTVAFIVSPSWSAVRAGGQGLGGALLDLLGER